MCVERLMSSRRSSLHDDTMFDALMQALGMIVQGRTLGAADRPLLTRLSSMTSRSLRVASTRLRLKAERTAQGRLRIEPSAAEWCNPLFKCRQTCRSAGHRHPS